MIKLKTILFPSITNKQITFIVIITIAFLIPDTILSNVSDFVTAQTTSFWGIAFFIIVAIVFIISQYLLLRFLWLKTKDMRSKSFLFNGLLKIIIASQSVMITILIIIICQILFTSQYYTMLLIISTVLTFLLTMCLLSILAKQFFLWYRSYRRDSLIVFKLCFCICHNVYDLLSCVVT
jgi:hypothetical protein